MTQDPRQALPSHTAASASAQASAPIPAPAPVPARHFIDAGAPVVVFDLDATLVAGDSMAAYLRAHLPRRPLALVMAVAAAPLWAPALLTMGTRRAGQRLLIAVATRGRSASDLAASAQVFAQDYVHARGRAHPRGVAAVQAHLAAGHRVVVATECWDVLAQALCTAMGLDPAEPGPAPEPGPGGGHRAASSAGAVNTRHTAAAGRTVGSGVRSVEVVAEDLANTRGRLGHLKVLAHYKDGKVQALQRAGVAFPVAAAYSDSLADLPLLTRAQMPHVVNPGWRQRWRFRRSLGTYIPHRWSPGGLQPSR